MQAPSRARSAASETISLRARHGSTMTWTRRSRLTVRISPSAVRYSIVPHYGVFTLTHRIDTVGRLSRRRKPTSWPELGDAPCRITLR